jgi:hypothetical protein
MRTMIPAFRARIFTEKFSAPGPFGPYKGLLGLGVCLVKLKRLPE